MYEIGNSLKNARVRQGIDFPTAEAGTRIRVRYLRAMEDEQFDRLPDPSYVRGFLRAYTTYLGLDPLLALDEYESRYGDLLLAISSDGRRRAQRRADGRPRRREAKLLWLAIGGVMGIALLGWMGVGGTTSVPPSSVVPEVRTSTTPRPTTAAMDIRFTGRGQQGAYLEVRRGSETGATVYSGVLVPGATHRFIITKFAWVRMGNPAAIAVTLNGSPLRITGGTGTFVISRSGAERLPAG
ncbi:MAG: helix-turn-helix domain-containing protein [Thermoleophilia bacterium]|nr:helix-turn-helix domain-containing protein [Thermoleophilia bacterium]